jgi:hypothetical protein
VWSVVRFIPLAENSNKRALKIYNVMIILESLISVLVTKKCRWEMISVVADLFELCNAHKDLCNHSLINNAKQSNVFNLMHD